MTKKAFQSFACAHPNEDGTIVVVNEDELFADDHPYVKWWPKMFGEHGEMVHVTPAPPKRSKVEQATAAPGESRDVTK